MKRSEGIDQELRDVVSRLAGPYGAERIILFGSHASDSAGEWSDVDLVVVKETSLSFYDRLREVARVCQWHHAFDVLVYTPAEFEEMSRHNPFVRDEVVNKGRVLYERAA